MAVYAISDLHLAFGVEKPMDIFGPRWHDYMARIENEWRACVGEADTVLIPGDISWAINLSELESDIRFIESLPGKKIITKGNHDYWWESITKMNAYLNSLGLTSIKLLYNNAFTVENYIVAGTRGWRAPSEDGFGLEDQKIHVRELIRFELSLQCAAKLRSQVTADAASDVAVADSENTVAPRIVAMLHYPPVDQIGKDFGFIKMMQAFGVDTCIYGHLHGDSCYRAFEDEFDGINLKLVSADHLGFRPTKI